MFYVIIHISVSVFFNFYFYFPTLQFFLICVRLDSLSVSLQVQIQYDIVSYHIEWWQLTVQDGMPVGLPVPVEEADHSTTVAARQVYVEDEYEIINQSWL